MVNRLFRGIKLRPLQCTKFLFNLQSAKCQKLEAEILVTRSLHLFSGVRQPGGNSKLS